MDAPTIASCSVVGNALLAVHTLDSPCFHVNEPHDPTIVSAVAQRVRVSLTCLDEGVMVAGQNGISVVRGCVPQTVLAGVGVDLAASDSAGGIVFQHTAPFADTRLPSSPIERIGSDGRVQTLVSSPANGTVQLQTVARVHGITNVVYSAAGAVAANGQGIESFPLTLQAQPLRAGKLLGDAVVLNAGQGYPGAEYTFAIHVSGGGGRYVLVFDSDGYDNLDARDPGGHKVDLPNNPFPTPTSDQPQLVAALSPDGTRLATAETTADGSTVTLVVHDLATGTATAHFDIQRPSGPANYLEFDGRKVLISLEDQAAPTPANASALVLDSTTGARKLLRTPGLATFSTTTGPLPVVKAATPTTSVSGVPPSTAAPQAAPVECDAFDNWLGPSTQAVVTLVQGRVSCDEVKATARRFFVDQQPPGGDWQCSKSTDLVHAGDCTSPRGRISLDIARPGDSWPGGYPPPPFGQ